MANIYRLTPGSVNKNNVTNDNALISKLEPIQMQQIILLWNNFMILKKGYSLPQSYDMGLRPGSANKDKGFP